MGLTNSKSAQTIAPAKTPEPVYIDEKLLREPPSFTYDGIAYSVLDNFIVDHGGRDAFQDMTIREVCTKFILPATKDWDLPYTEILKEYQFDRDDVDRANALLCCPFQSLFLDVVDALEAYTQVRDSSSGSGSASESRLYIWFDIFSYNQNLFEPEHKILHSVEWWRGEYKESISSFKRILVYLSPFHQPDSYSQIRCLWDMYCMMNANAAVELLFCPSEKFCLHRVSDVTGSRYSSFGVLSSSDGVPGQESKQNSMNDTVQESTINAHNLTKISGGEKPFKGKKTKNISKVGGYSRGPSSATAVLEESGGAGGAGGADGVTTGAINQVFDPAVQYPALLESIRCSINIATCSCDSPDGRQRARMLRAAKLEPGGIAGVNERIINKLQLAFSNQALYITKDVVDDIEVREAQVRQLQDEEKFDVALLISEECVFKRKYLCERIDRSTLESVHMCAEMNTAVGKHAEAVSLLEDCIAVHERLQRIALASETLRSVSVSSSNFGDTFGDTGGGGEGSGAERLRGGNFNASFRGGASVGEKGIGSLGRQGSSSGPRRLLDRLNSSKGVLDSNTHRNIFTESPSTSRSLLLSNSKLSGSDSVKYGVLGISRAMSSDRSFRGSPGGIPSPSYSPSSPSSSSSRHAVGLTASSKDSFDTSNKLLTIGATTEASGRASVVGMRSAVPDPEALQLREELAAAHCRNGNLAEAAVVLKHAQEGWLLLCGEAHPRRLRCLILQASVYVGLKYYEEARILYSTGEGYILCVIHQCFSIYLYFVL